MWVKVISYSVHVTIAAMKTYESLLIVLLLTDVQKLRIKNVSVLPWKHKNGFRLRCCRTAEYFVLLSATYTYRLLNAKCQIFFFLFNQLWIFSTNFLRIPQYYVLRQMSAVGATLIYEDRRTDWRTNITELIGAFRCLWKRA